MVRPNPPWARMVSQVNSSSDSVPSTLLCWFVSGDNINLFGIAEPCINETESKREVMVVEATDTNWLTWRNGTTQPTSPVH